MKNSALWLRAGLATAIVDGLYACVLSAGFYGSTVMKLWQGVASTILGKSAFDGGWRTAAVGIVMHVGVAFFWSGVFVLLASRSSWLRERISTSSGVVAVSTIYGPLIWMTMSLLVVPALVHRPPAIGIRWWIQLAGHALFVGLPIVASTAWRPRLARVVA